MRINPVSFLMLGSTTILCISLQVFAHDLDFQKQVQRAFAVYMAESCERRVHPNWANFPVEKCSYQVVDRNGTIKKAEVSLLIPNIELASSWVANACVNASGDSNCESKVIDRIRDSSGFQFPVSGVVYEDILPTDGIYEAYCFRDGVTVVVEGFKHRSTKILTDSEIDICVSGEIKSALRYARVHSGVREDYIAFGGKEDVGTSDSGNRKLSWLDVVRDSYQEAWRIGSYSLLNFWVQRNIL